MRLLPQRPAAAPLSPMKPLPASAAAAGAAPLPPNLNDLLLWQPLTATPLRQALTAAPLKEALTLQAAAPNPVLMRPMQAAAQHL